MSSDHEEGGSKRQRVSRACDYCRRKKIKCDGVSPVCTNCKAFDLNCTYKDTTKKRGPPKGYMEAIENRLHKLESLLGEMAQGDDPKAKLIFKELNTPLETPTGEQIFSKPQRRSTYGGDKSKVFFWQPFVKGSASPSLDNCILDTSSASSSPTSAAGTKSRLSPTTESADITGQLALDAHGQYRYLGKSSGFYLLQKSRTYHHGAFHLYGQQRSNRTISPLTYFSFIPSGQSVDPYELPSPQLSTKLVRLYLDKFYPVLPLFYKRQLSSSLDDPAEPISPLLLNAIYALASRICDDVETRSDPSNPDTAGEVFFERAKCLLDNQYDIPRISTVQALLLLSSYQHGTMKTARTWLYSGMAFRMALDLGLNRNCDHWQIPPDEKERRKRVFWCAYVCDVMISATFGRSSTFEESDCDIPFPSVEDDIINAHAPGPLMVLSHLVKVCDILGHVLKNIYYAKALKTADMRHIGHAVSSLTGRLSHWYKNLPPALCLDNGSHQPLHYPVCVSQLHMVYHTTVILLHRLFIPNNNTINVSPESISEYNTCAVSATAIMNISNNMLQSNTLNYVFPSSVYCVFTSGIIFINAASCNDATKSFDAKIKINNIMRLLETMEKTWISAAHSANILGELAGLRELNLPTSENTLRPIVQQRSSADIGNYDETKRRPISNDRKPWNQHAIMTGSLSDELGTQKYNGQMTSQGLQHLTLGKNNMDPFAAPDSVPVSSQRQFDISEAAFWGVPPSLDLNDWNQYLESQLSAYPDKSTLLSVQQPSSSEPPLIPSRHLSSQYNPPPSPLTSSNTFTSSQNDIPTETTSLATSNLSSPSARHTRKHLIHGDSNVDVLSGMPIPLDLNGVQQNATTTFGMMGAHGTLTNTLIENQPLDPQGTSNLYGNDGMVYY